MSGVGHFGSFFVLRIVSPKLYLNEYSLLIIENCIFLIPLSASSYKRKRFSMVSCFSRIIFFLSGFFMLTLLLLHFFHFEKNCEKIKKTIFFILKIQPITDTNFSSTIISILILFSFSFPFYYLCFSLSLFYFFYHLFHFLFFPSSSASPSSS